jgi:2-C-methyl-D-erythritol 4-phosphate cytidylyltransferase
MNIEQIKGCVVAITENDTAFKNSVFANHDKLLATVRFFNSVHHFCSQ